MPIIRNKDQSNKKKKLNPLKWSWRVETGVQGCLAEWTLIIFITLLVIVIVFLVGSES